MSDAKPSAALFLLACALLASGVGGQDETMVSVRFELGEYATDEDAGTMNVSLVAIGLVELNCGGPVDVTVGLANKTFDATPFDISSGGGDFILDVDTLSNDPFMITFQPIAEVSSAHVISLIGDNLYEGPESFYLEIMSISAPESCADRIKIGTPSQVQVEIEDNDVLNVNFTDTRITIREGEKATITGQTHRSPFQRILQIGLICFSPLSNSRLQAASENVDFDATSQNRLVFDQINVQPPVTASVEIATIDDEFAEDTESFVCTLRLTVDPSDPLQAINPDTVTISIIDNDELFISWEKPFYFVRESDRLALVSLEASNRFTVNFTVSGRPEEIDTERDFFFVNGTRYSLADRIDDFMVVDNVAFEFSTTLGSLVSMNTFRLEDDDCLEEDEVLQGTFEIPSIIGRQLSAMARDPEITYIIIQDDDTVNVDFVNTSYTVSESGGSLNVSIVLTGKHVIPLNVTVECVEDDPISARDGRDFISIHRVIEFPPNCDDEGTTMSDPITVTILPDMILEGTENFVCRMVNLSHPRIIAGENAKVFIIDDDNVTVRYNSDLYLAVEEQPNVTLVLQLEGEAEIEVCVEASAMELPSGSSRPRATANEDFIPRTARVVFKPGDKEEDFVVDLVDNVAPENVEYFMAGVVQCDTTAEGGVVIGQPDQPLVEISDNDRYVSCSLRSTFHSVFENEKFVEVCAQLNDTYGEDIDCSLNFRPAGDAMATAGEDYQAGPLTLTLPANQLTVCVNVSITDDFVVERDEEFSVTLDYDGGQTGVSLSLPQRAIVTIFNDDAIHWRFERNSYNVSEDESVLEVKVQANGTASFDYPISVTPKNLTATSPADYTQVTSTPITIPSGTTEVTLTYNIEDDDIFEGDEEFELLLMVDMATMDEGILIGSPDVATVTILDNEELTIFFSPVAYNVTEGDMVSLVARADKRFERSFDVVISTMNGSAMGGEDYERFSGIVRFDVGSQTGVVNLTTLSDDKYEGMETFTAVLTLAGTTPTGVNVGAQDTASIDIMEATELCVTFDASSYTVEEGETASLMITLDKPSNIPITVMVMLTDGSAVAPGDYDSSAMSVTFSPGSQMMDVEVGTSSDDIIELDEYFMATLVVEGSNDLLRACEPNMANVTIVDKTSATVFFKPSEYGVTEGEVAVLMLEISAEVAPGVEITVAVVPNNGTATSPMDFEITLYNVVFSGTNMASLEVPTFNDTVVEGPEEFTASILTTSGVEAGNPDVATIDINDASMLEVFFSQSMYFVNESDPVAVVTVKASSVHQRSYNISVSVRDGTATNGDDYRAVSFDIIFEPGELMKTMEIPIINDLIAEGVEDVLLAIFIPKSSLDLGVIPGNPRRAVLEILDDDCVTVYFDPSSYDVREGEDVLVSIATDGEFSTSFNVTVQLQDGSATAPGDFVSSSSPYTVEFGAGESSASIIVETANDNMVECLEAFEATLMTPRRGRGVCVVRGDPGVAEIRIVDDENAISVSFQPTQYSVAEGNRTTVTLVTNSSAYSCPFTVSLMFMDKTATSGNDYVPMPVSVTFSPGQGELSFEVMTTEDNVTEQMERFKVVIVNITTDCDDGDDRKVIIGSEDTAVIDIVDDDVLSVFFDPSEYKVVEGDQVELVVRTDKEFDFPFNVTIMTMPDTAMEGLDYKSGTFTVGFFPGSTTSTVAIETEEDSILEGSETFEAVLMLAPESSDLGVEVGTADVANITIIDNTTIEVFFRPDVYSVKEGERVNITLVTNRIFAVDFEVTVTLRGISATGGEDYEDNSPYTVTFNSGSMLAILQIPITVDTTVESSEVFEADLTIPRESFDKGIRARSPNVSTVTIMDGNGAVSVFFEPNSTTVVEGEMAKLIVLADKDFDFDFTVNLVTMDDTATAGSDFMGGVYPLTFTGGSRMAMLFINTSSDDVAELTEQFKVMIEVPDSVTTVMAGDPDTAVVTITDNDDICVFIDPSTDPIIEGRNATVTVKMNSSMYSFDCVVELTDDADTAAAGDDYTEGPYMVLFSAGQSEVSFQIPTAGDLLAEGNEAFYVDIISTCGPHVGICSPSRGRIVIVDDDSVNVFFQPSVYTVKEGETVEVTVATSSQDFNFPFMVDLVPRDGTAVQFLDYFFDGITLTFQPGQPNATFSVLTTDNIVLELVEEFYIDIVNVSVPTLVGVGTPETATVRIVDDKPAISVSFQPTEYSVTEGSNTTVTLVTNSSAYSFPFTVSLMFMDETATSGSDYVPMPVSVTFSPGQEALSFEVMTTEDNVAEQMERFKVVITGANESTQVMVGSDDTAFVNIEDDDEPISISITTDNTTEDRGVVTVCAVKSSASFNSIRLTVSPKEIAPGVIQLEGGDLLIAQGGGTDFSDDQVTIEIPAGSTRECVNVTVVNDDVVECDELFNVTLMVEEGQDPGAVAEFNIIHSHSTVTIIDDDAILVMFEEPMYMVTEGESSLMIRLLTTGAASFDFDININIQPPVPMQRNAIADQDFALNLSSLSFESGQTTNAIIVAVLEDEIFESNESFTLELSVPEAFRMKDVFEGDPNKTVVVIKDDDTATVIFNPALYNATEGEKVEVCLSVDREIEQAFTAIVETVNVTALGSLDYFEGVYLAEFLPGQSTTCIIVVIINDTIIETPEEFNLVIREVGPTDIGVIIGDPDVAIVTIYDNTVEVPVKFERIRYNVTEGQDESAIVALVTDVDHRFSFTVSVTVTDGTAKRDVDYQSSSTVDVHFPAGVNRATFSIDITNDNVSEMVESFTLELNIPDEAAILGVVSMEPDMATVVITDEDAISFEISDYTIREDEGPLNVQITASGHSDSPYNVTINPRSNTASAVEDFDPSPITITFNPGETMKTFSIKIADNNRVEPEEEFSLEVSFSNVAPVDVVATSTVTIIDNDAVVTFVKDLYVFNEDVFNGRIGLNVAGDLSKPFTVDIVSTDVTATEGEDYRGKEFEFKFEVNVDMGTFQIRILADKDIEANETFTLTINEVDDVNRVSIGEPNVSTVVILEVPPGPQSPDNQVNDSVVGDPLYTIPLGVYSRENFSEFEGELVSLCYEFAGSGGQFFNLISDKCTFANARYSVVGGEMPIHVISEVGIRTEGINGSCHSVHVKLDSCQTLLDGRVFSGRYQANGILLMTNRRRMRIETDNCNPSRKLVMWVSCARNSGFEMLHFTVMRGDSIRPTAHGLIGQFWNIPVDIKRYSGLYDGKTIGESAGVYEVTFSPPDKPDRSVLAEFGADTWDDRDTPCLFAGDSYGGPIWEAPPQYGSVIEGRPQSYEVASLFDHEFEFTQFIDNC